MLTLKSVAMSIALLALLVACGGSKSSGAVLSRPRLPAQRAELPPVTQALWGMARAKRRTTRPLPVRTVSQEGLRTYRDI